VSSCGDAYGIHYSRTISGFGPQNPGGGSEEEQGGTWRNHRGCVEAKQIYEGSMAIRSTEKELDHYSLGSSGSFKISKGISEIV